MSVAQSHASATEAVGCGAASTPGEFSPNFFNRPCRTSTNSPEAGRGRLGAWRIAPSTIAPRRVMNLVHGIPPGFRYVRHRHSQARVILPLLATAAAAKNKLCAALSSGRKLESMAFKQDKTVLLTPCFGSFILLG